MLSDREGRGQEVGVIRLRASKIITEYNLDQSWRVGFHVCAYSLKKVIFIKSALTSGFGHKWNLTRAQEELAKELDELRLSGWLVTLASGLSSYHLTSDIWSSQLVKSTWKVTPLKSHAQAVRRPPPRGPEGGGGLWPKKGQNRSLFLFFCPFFFGENDVLWSILRCCPQREQDLDLVVLLWRWWILRSRL